MNKFKDDLKVDLEEQKAIQKCQSTMKNTIDKLNKIEETYNPNPTVLDERTNILRSGTNIYLNIMLLADLLFEIIEETQRTIDVEITARIKSVESTEKKDKKKKEKDANYETKDIVAGSILFSRIHNNKDFFKIFDSNEIRGAYYERMDNILLILYAINYIHSLDMHKISSEIEDVSPAEETEKKLTQIQESCKDIFDNVVAYYEDEGINLSEVENNDYPIEKRLRQMCVELIQQEIKNAIEKLPKEIEKLNRSIKSENISLTEKSIKQLNLTHLKRVKKMLDTAEVDYTQKELMAILYGVINDEKINLYTSVLNHLKNEEKIQGSKEKKYCEILMLILYKITKLELINEEGYPGLTYNSAMENLINQLKQYKYCEVDKGSYGNITFENLQKLFTNLVRVNARLSDPLVYKVADYLMQNNLQYTIQLYMGEDTKIVRELLIKPNGYVGIHFDTKSVELQIKSLLRYLIASKGSASHGSRKEKIRVPSTLTDAKRYSSNYIKAVKRCKQKLIGEKILEEDEELIQLAKDEWRSKNLGIIPRYFEIKYVAEENALKAIFHSEAYNMEKYYAETSVKLIREETQSIVQSFKDFGFVSDEELILTIDKKMLLDFKKYALEATRDGIAKKIKEARINKHKGTNQTSEEIVH